MVVSTQPFRSSPAGTTRGSRSVPSGVTPHRRRLSSSEEREALVRITALRDLRWETLRSEPAVAAAIDELVERLGSPLRTDDLTTEVLRALHGDTSMLRLSPDALADPQQRGAYLRRLRRIDRDYRRLRNDLLLADLGHLVQIARRYHGRWMSLADRVQEGTLGLVEAIERFDVARGTRFSTYATWWIRHAITGALIRRARTVRIPAHLHRIYGRARLVEPELAARLGRAPTTEELAGACDVEPASLDDARRAMELEQGLVDPSTGSLAQQPDYDRRIDDARNLERMWRAFRRLDARDQDILRHRFGLDDREPSTLRELGRRYRLSRERIRQLQGRALQTLRTAIDDEPVAAD